MKALDLRVGALSLVGNPGTSRTLRLVFTSGGEPVEPGPVSVWIGGDERSPNDFDGAVEHSAVVVGGEATVTIPIPEVRELLRLTVDGALAAIGTVAPSLRGTPDQDQTVQVNLGAVEVRLDLAAVPLDLAARLEALEAGKQDADPALDELSGATVEAWGKSWLAISEAAAARAALGLGSAATMSPAEIAADPAFTGAFAALNAGREGTGSPQSVVSAPVGTVYRDLAATNGAVMWVKASGTGNTGWRVIQGDTGWRNVTGELLNGWTASIVRIRRTAEIVWWHVEGLDGTSSTDLAFLPLFTGFDSGVSNLPRFLLHTSASALRRGYRGATALTMASDGASGSLFGTFSVVPATTPPWPTSLPGTAA